VRAGGSRLLGFFLLLMVFPARCVSSVSARFLLYRAHAICFVTLVAILEPPSLRFLIITLLHFYQTFHAFQFPLNMLQNSYDLLVLSFFLTPFPHIQGSYAEICLSTGSYSSSTFIGGFLLKMSLTMSIYYVMLILFPAGYHGVDS
jgi:hypothetical protein